jgi:cell division protein FtsI (penicillin-binding protein 3)
VRNLDPRRARWIRLRMGILCGAMAVGLGGFVSSAYRVQVEDGAAWRETAEKQRQRRLHVEPKRGTIYDRNGTALAVSVEVPSLSVDVGEMLHGVEDPAAQAMVLKDAAVRLAEGLQLDANELYEKLSSKRRFIWLKRRISSDETEFVHALSDAKKQLKPIHGLSIEGEGHRYYPGRELAGPLLGFVSPDGQGRDGIELSLDEELKGHADEVNGLRDRSGTLLFSQGTTDERALAGHDVYLTIDEGIQHVAERELDAARRTYETKGASIVVVDPNSGEILALASTPGYNPNDYSESDVEARRDRVVSDRFEPGSVMKAFSIAAALAAGTLKPTETTYCEHGVYMLAGAPVHDTHLNDWLTPTQILAKSSNIGALKIALNFGAPGLYAAYRRFGFGEPTGVPLPGEAQGVLLSKGRPWVEVDAAYAAFGQGISVTTLQLAMAMGAIANGGRLLEPVLVHRITDGRGETLREGAPHVRREALPPGIAKMVGEMLTAVTEPGGTAPEAAVPGFRVAGKTSTAQKIDPATGKYSADKFTAVFTGFVPAERPRLVIAVVLDEPVIGHVGGDLSGPVFRRVAESSLRYLGVTPSNASAKLESVSRKGDVADATLAAMVANEPPQMLDPAVSNVAPPKDAVRVPDATGMSMRDAIRVVSASGLVPQIEGTGRLVRQAPVAGTAAAKGTRVRLLFEPSS